MVPVCSSLPRRYLNVPSSTLRTSGVHPQRQRRPPRRHHLPTDSTSLGVGQDQHAGPGAGHDRGQPSPRNRSISAERVRHGPGALALVQAVVGGLGQQAGLPGERVHEQGGAAGVEGGIPVRDRGRQEAAGDVWNLAFWALAA